MATPRKRKCPCCDTEVETAGLCGSAECRRRWQKQADEPAEPVLMGDHPQRWARRPISDAGRHVDRTDEG